ncbi:MAG TPA: biotin carboxylase N-terminal domain-containing protein [Ramlibacter sp.]|nr:biotin carboxylase N-terminal domain-containing protein [Ramlibacter sp.]
MRRLLIANRGEIARRIIRTAHRLGMETVAVHSGADARALHVREATAAFALDGDASADSYLRIDKVLAAARAAAADAVHPGYGFLSENPEFAQAVIDAGLLWVGPPPQAMRALGNKSLARQLAQSRGVPCLPGYQGEDQSDQRLQAEARRIGFPVMVKAAAGGGGRGMRLVTQPGQLLAALHSARSEAQSAFGSSELLLERALQQPRHVEVQIFADAHGRCIHLGERDCSVQRRHQKLIEETPSPAVGVELRERMARCAVELAQAAGYAGAGTVEFLVEDGEFFLMEMNTRLQVEHPVTEAVTGLDLVEWQLRVAQGEPLPLAQEQVRFDGHAIEVRLCAEDEHFTPHTGTVLRFGHGDGAGASLRFDHALFEGLEVSPYYDSMLGKLVAHAPTRPEAIERLAAALDRTELLGLPSNRRFLAACLRHPQFRAGQALIPFLEQHAGELRDLVERQERLVAGDCALAAVFGSSPGERGKLPCPFPRPLRLRHRGQALALQVRELPGGALEVEQDGGVRRTAPPKAACVRLDSGAWHIQCGAVDLFIEDASFEPAGNASAQSAANELRAPFNGKVIAVKTQPGAAVGRGDTLLVLESMKLEHALAATRDGIVKTVHVAAGQQAATAQLLVTLEAVQ